MYSKYFPALIFFLVLISGCGLGRPNPDSLYQQARAQQESAERALTDGKWKVSLDGWNSAAAILNANPQLQFEGKTFAQYNAAMQEDVAKRLTTALPVLKDSAAKDRNSFAQIEALIKTFGDPVLIQKWNTTLKAEIEQQLTLNEMESKVKAEQYRNLKLANSYLFWIERGTYGGEYVIDEFQNSVAGILRNKLAPAQIEILNAPPKRLAGMGTIRLILDWQEVAYREQGRNPNLIDSPENIVPIKVDAKLQINTRLQSTNLDGLKLYTATEPAPEKIQDLATIALGSKNRKALLDKLTVQLGALPALENGTALVQMSNAQNAIKRDYVWSYRITTESERITGTTLRMNHEVQPAHKPLVNALQKIFPDAELVEYTEGMASQGHLAIHVKIVEVEWGGTKPSYHVEGLAVKMTVEVLAQTRAGYKCTWDKFKSFKASVPQPDKVDDDGIRKNSIELYKQIAALIEKQANVVIQKQ